MYANCFMSNMEMFIEPLLAADLVKQRGHQQSLSSARAFIVTAYFSNKDEFHLDVELVLIFLYYCTLLLVEVVVVGGRFCGHCCFHQKYL